MRSQGVKDVSLKPATRTSFEVQIRSSSTSEAEDFSPLEDGLEISASCPGGKLVPI